MIPLRCTVIDGCHPATSVDLDLYAPSGAVLSDLADQVLARCKLPTGLELAADGRRLRPGQPLGLPPLVDGALLVALPASRGPATDDGAQPAGRVAGVLWLCVVAGPDAGLRLPLRPGTHSVGRGPDVTLTVHDPAMSRRHLSITVGPDGALLHDLGSTNGTRVGSRRVEAAGTTLRIGQRLVAGASTLLVRVDDQPLASTRPDGRGGIVLSRAPRELPAVQPVRIVRPAAPPDEAPARVPWVAALVPLVLCVPVALLLGQPTYLAFGLIGPVAMIATTVVERRGRRRRERESGRQWRQRDQAAASATAEALAAELELRRRRSGDAAELTSTAARATRRLWERCDGDDDLLEVCLGAARARSAVSVSTSPGAIEGGSGQEWLADTPFTLRLDDVGHFGLTGDTGRVDAAARYLLGQLTTRCTPRAVQLVVLSDDQAWGWTRWLPHGRSLGAAALEDEVARRWAQATVTGKGVSQPVPRLVVLLDERQTSSTGLLAMTLRHGPDVGVHLVCLTLHPVQLPSSCGANVLVPASGPATVRRQDSDSIDDLHLDGVAGAWADELARALAPLRDATPEADGAGSLPATIGLPELVDDRRLSASGLAECWLHEPRSTRVVLGAGADGAAEVDLVRDGPHVLVAGTTGAGKSELLLTMVTSLALGNRPDELCFVLVDYKGGAAFQRCWGLPHVVGLVTDLDAHLAGRALTALQAELTRRERLLAEVGVADLGEYQRWSDAEPGRARLARLVLVIDEFRLLAKELPDFLEGLVRLAAVGRSLGVHLMLATQRPAGIVSADIRANVNLRICLRVRDRVDSEDVLDAPDAASLPDASPGRALLRSGSGPLTAFQAALAGGAPCESRPDLPMVLLAGQRVPIEDRTDRLAELVRAVRSATDAVAAQPPPSPWLAPLPDLLPLDGLVDAPSFLPGTAAASGVALGLVDRPAQGRQELARWDPRCASHLAISGAPRTGRTSALLTVLRGLLEDTGSHQRHVHVVDAAGGALTRALAPAVESGRRALGTVLSGDQPLAVRRLVSVLADRLRQTSGRPDRPPGTVLVVDGWEALAEALEQVDHGRGLDELLTLVRDGEQAGLRLVVAGGRGVLLSRLASLVGERLLLRPTDPSDLLLAGLPAQAGPLHQPPGRAVHLPSGDVIQLAWPGDADQVHRRLTVTEHAAAEAEPECALGQPVRLRALPAKVELRLIEPPREPQPTRSGPVDSSVVLGLGGDEAGLIRLDLDRHRRVLVHGPGGSGRSQTLATIARQLHERGQRVTAVGSGESPLLAGPWPILALDGARALGSQVGSQVSSQVSSVLETDFLLVDDAEDLQHHAGLASAIDQLAMGLGGPCLVWSVRRSGVRSPSSALVASAHRQRTGVLLQPRHAHDGEPLGVHADPVDQCVPGRGLLVLRGQATVVQIAC
ncbi:FtsK/SpoIIIE domain-containing protein [Angustibacter sp. McL0619]|uniref:FtsK/SpoIIIE domain-containing protein n=1 Tax=Angustibacter sp. McL0619 TaxID=3415676 RepID=UPI003CF5C29C